MILTLVPMANAGVVSLGVQPSQINLFLSKTNDRIILPLKLWNSGDTSANFTLTPVNLTEFTNFSTTSIFVPANTTRLSNYTTVTIIFTKTTENKTVVGGIYIQARPISTNAIVKIVPQIFMRISINQTDVETEEAPYSFPQSPVANTSNQSSIPNVIPNQGGGGGFFSRIPLMVWIIIASILIGLLVWWFMFRTFL